MELLFLASIAGVVLFAAAMPLAIAARRRARPRRLAAGLTLEEAALAHDWALSSLANAFHLDRHDAAETIRRQAEVAAFLYETIARKSGKRISRPALARYRRRLHDQAMTAPYARSAERKKLLEGFAPKLSVKEPDDQMHAQAVVVEMLRAVA